MEETYTIKLNLTKDEMPLLVAAVREFSQGCLARLQEELAGGKNGDGTITIPDEVYEKYIDSEILEQKVQGEIDVTIIFGENK